MSNVSRDEVRLSQSESEYAASIYAIQHIHIQTEHAPIPAPIVSTPATHETTLDSHLEATALLVDRRADTANQQPLANLTAQACGRTADAQGG
jgi:hypothetical protein